MSKNYNNYIFNYTSEYVKNKISEWGINRDTFFTKLSKIAKLTKEDKKKYKKKTDGLISFYKLYPHKCQILKGNTIPLPYVKKQDIDCNNSNSLTYREYINYSTVYFKYLTLYLRSGLPYKLPCYLGSIEMANYRGGYYDHNDSKFDSNDYLGNQKFILKWVRGRNTRNLHFWKIQFTRKKWRSLFKWIEENPSRLNKYNRMSTTKHQKK